MIKGKTDPVEDINGMLKEPEGSAGVSIKGIFLDETLREFFYLEKPVEIPSLPVKAIGHEESRDILKMIMPFIGQYLAGHEYMTVRNPQSEEHSIHLSAVVPGTVVDFIHVMRLDFKFTSNNGTIIRSGSSGTYPVYSTDRIYFKSRLIPVEKGSGMQVIKPVRLRDSLKVENSDQGKRLFVSVLFDDFSSREISIELSRKAGDVPGIPVTIYPMVAYEYFTACLSLPEPSWKRVMDSAPVFEPFFIYLYSELMGAESDISKQGIISWSSHLESRGGGLAMTDRMKKELADLLLCYSAVADDDLLLKGWKKINAC